MRKQKHALYAFCFIFADVAFILRKYHPDRGTELHNHVFAAITLTAQMCLRSRPNRHEHASKRLRRVRRQSDRRIATMATKDTFATERKNKAQQKKRSEMQ